MPSARPAVVLFCGNAVRDERQKNLPRRFLSRLHDALLRRLRLLDADVYVARHDDREFRIGEVAWPVGTLGNQIDTALRFCFQSHDRVVIVAGDAAIDPAIVQRALDAHEAVIAESGDGGFALAGFSAPPDIDWNAVVANRAHAAEALRDRVSIEELPRIDDIDTPEDARRVVRAHPSSLLRLIATLLTRQQPNNPTTQQPSHPATLQLPSRAPPAFV
jgi:2-phospho-L-lactate guanylyltransferase (CobY/MobA/RfbA family)